MALRRTTVPIVTAPSARSILVLGVELVPLQAQLGGRPLVQGLGLIPAFCAFRLQLARGPFSSTPGPVEVRLRVRARVMQLGLGRLAGRVYLPPPLGHFIMHFLDISGLTRRE